MSIDLRTTYLGLELKNPLVASASPLTGHLEILRQMEEAGVAAVVRPSLFEEQFEREELAIRRLIEMGTDECDAVLSELFELDSYNPGPANYLVQIQQAKKTLSIPVIASLNGVGPGNRARQVSPRLTLSKGAELQLPLRWIAILRPQLSISLAASTGVHTPDDVFKLLLVGADVTMTTSALLRHGPAYLRTLLDGLQARLEEKGYGSIGQMKGMLSQQNCPDPSAFERANYVKMIATSTPFRDELSG